MANSNPSLDTDKGTNLDANQPNRILWFSRECGRRRVSRATLSYGLILWLNVQIGDVLFPLLHIPDWALHLVVVIGLMGLPVVIYLAWTFQMTPHGLRMDCDAQDPKALSTGATEVWLNLVLILAGLAVIALLLIDICTR